MLTINREQFLNDLSMVKAGLSAREFLEQSTMLVFDDGKVMTFNDEICCKKDLKLNGVTGAVHASTLFAILEKMNDETLEIGEGGEGELEFRGKRKAFGIAREKEIFLPVDRVEEPKKWRPLPKEFSEAVGLVRHCVSSDETKFILTCVHIAPEWMEACDNLQAMRVLFDTGVEESILTRGTSLAQLESLGMEELSVTKSWLHFRNNVGLVYSCRRYTEEFPKLEGLLDVSGSPITIPRTLGESSDRAAVFADTLGEPLINVRLDEDRMRIKGEGALGWYKELKKVEYSGDRMEFIISAHLLKHVSEHYAKAEITDGRLKVLGGKNDRWTYVTALGRKAEPEESEPAEKTKRTKRDEPD